MFQPIRRQKASFKTIDNCSSDDSRVEIRIFSIIELSFDKGSYQHYHNM